MNLKEFWKDWQQNGLFSCLMGPLHAVFFRASQYSLVHSPGDDLLLYQEWRGSSKIQLLSIDRSISFGYFNFLIFLTIIRMSTPFHPSYKLKPLGKNLQELRKRTYPKWVFILHKDWSQLWAYSERYLALFYFDSSRNKREPLRQISSKWF